MTSPRIVAIIPVGSLDAAKSRLGGALDAEERRDLVGRMLDRTVAAAMETNEIAGVIVVSPDPEALAAAATAGARTMRQRTAGLNAGIRAARDDALAGGADGMLILPIDLPFVSPGLLRNLLAAAAGIEPPVVVLVPDRHGRGTNALFVSPPEAIDVAFGGDSRAAHAARALAAGVRYEEVNSDLGIDLDTPDDLLLLEHTAPEVIRAG
ncbi:MAG: 2-phospho-L-lactate guanylyltransferase [Chloroflexi bacterium]|nr:2-phospho-L-lactate guanylyltransferase [Chloroflexota bacterium]